MRIQRLLQVLSGIAWTISIVLFLAVSPSCASAQGAQNNIGEGTFVGIPVYVYSNLSIDAMYNGDAYTDEDSAVYYAFYPGTYWIELESILNETNQFPLYDIITTDASSVGDTSLNMYFSAGANASYDLNAKGNVCYQGDPYVVCDDIVDVNSHVSTVSGSGGGDPNNPPPPNTCNNPPNIDSNDPSYGNPGDSGTMTIYGENLTNLDGSPGSISYWSDTLCVGPFYIGSQEYCTSTGDYTNYVTFGNALGNVETITVPYYIDPNAPEDLGSIVVQTGCGTAYGPDFNIP